MIKGLESETKRVRELHEEIEALCRYRGSYSAGASDEYLDMFHDVWEHIRNFGEKIVRFALTAGDEKLAGRRLAAMSRTDLFLEETTALFVALDRQKAFHDGEFYGAVPTEIRERLEPADGS